MSLLVRDLAIGLCLILAATLLVPSPGRRSERASAAACQLAGQR